MSRCNRQCEWDRGGITPASTLRAGDSLQVLIIALQYLAWELHAFVARGGRVVDRDGDDVDLPSVSGRPGAHDLARDAEAGSRPMLQALL
jgi:hypothetical protein